MQSTHEGGCVCGGHGAYFEGALLADGDSGGCEGTKKKTSAVYHFRCCRAIKFCPDKADRVFLSRVNVGKRRQVQPSLCAENKALITLPVIHGIGPSVRTKKHSGVCSGAVCGTARSAAQSDETVGN